MACCSRLAGVPALFREAWSQYLPHAHVYFVLVGVPYALALILELQITASSGWGSTLAYGSLSAILVCLCSCMLLLYVWRGGGRISGLIADGLCLLPAFVALTIVAWLPLYGAMLALVVPGLMLFVWLVFAPYALVEMRGRPVQALLVSREAVRGQFWAIAGRTVPIYLALALLLGATFLLEAYGQVWSAKVVEWVVVSTISPLVIHYFALVYRQACRVPAVQVTSTWQTKATLALFALIGLLALAFAAYVVAFAPLEAVSIPN